MTPDEEFARKKLAIDTRLKRADQALAREQFLLAQTQFEWQTSQAKHSGWAALLSPTGVVLVAAAIGLIGTAIGKWADYQINRRQQETAVILKAIEVPQGLSLEAQAELRAKNLLWFADAGYIKLSQKYLDDLKVQAKAVPGQSLAAPIVQSQYSAPPAPSGSILFPPKLLPSTADPLRIGQTVSIEVTVPYELKVDSGTVSVLVSNASNENVAYQMRQISRGSNNLTIPMKFVVPSTRFLKVFVFLEENGQLTTRTVNTFCYEVSENLGDAQARKSCVVGVQ
jgi:hypothetical protein